MKNFRDKAIDYITEHVNTSNPIRPEGETRIGSHNRPFFMYLSWRAPHRPMSHDWEFNPAEPFEHMPYVSNGKPGEQLGIFDEYIGDIMARLHELEIADNTVVVFTSDNGPDLGTLSSLLNKKGHLRMSTMRGKKASVYEGGHRVPFLVWWPNGIHQSLYGTNYDLPVSQTDLFATFADIMDYPLPGGDKCIYAYDSDTAPVHNRDISILRRRVSDKCIEISTTAAPATTASNPFSTVSPTSSATTTVTTMTGPGSKWTVKNGHRCLGQKKAGDRQCDWNTCDECNHFWTEATGNRKSKKWLPNKIKIF